MINSIFDEFSFSLLSVVADMRLCEQKSMAMKRAAIFEIGQIWITNVACFQVHQPIDACAAAAEEAEAEKETQGLALKDMAGPLILAVAFCFLGVARAKRQMNFQKTIENKFCVFLKAYSQKSQKIQPSIIAWKLERRDFLVRHFSVLVCSAWGIVADVLKWFFLYRTGRKVVKTDGDSNGSQHVAKTLVVPKRDQEMNMNVQTVNHTVHTVDIHPDPDRKVEFTPSAQEAKEALDEIEKILFTLKHRSAISSKVSDASETCSASL